MSGGVGASQTPSVTDRSIEMQQLIEKLDIAQPSFVFVAEGDEDKSKEKADLIAEGDEEKSTEKADLIAEGEDDKKTEKADLIAEGEDDKKTEKADLIA
jgi:hypothetical protein